MRLGQRPRPTGQFRFCDKTLWPEATYRRRSLLGCQGMTVHHGGEVWLQGSGWECTSSNTSEKQRANSSLSKPTSSEILTSGKALLLDLPKEHLQLGTKYWSIWAYGGHFSLKSHSHSSKHYIRPNVVYMLKGVLGWVYSSVVDRLPSMQEAKLWILL